MQPSQSLPDLKGGVYDAEDIMEMVQDSEQRNSESNIEYTNLEEAESTEMPGALPNNYKPRN